MPGDYLVRDGTLYINSVQKDAEGSYSCLGVGVSGTVLFEATARLRVIGEMPAVCPSPTAESSHKSGRAYL